MGKAKTFAAKLAHESSTEGKVICPVCNTELKKLKIITNKKKGSGSWSPKYEYVRVCKCNENDLLAGKKL
ncbi:MAG TPA: hypothetical protein PKH17_06625 [Candidatus Syntrophosphaera sp.]|jgi:uncharacterized Zn finger protein (UPF0148 family)|nr:MAG: hypothetical protein BWY18_00630 [Candidatus Cloacimonetes bacterium ADurb.Bin211]HOD60399.1 hypothetical protein [Candidatus Syntrophosphaera sp.]HQM79483.1 hypothetical protein [Candidatus Syntrophosphaera sp.]